MPDPLINVLFICGKARMRSPTAADLVAHWPGISTDFAGLSHDADERLSAEQIAWADTIIVMERRQAARLTSLFARQLRGKPVHVLNIPDKFSYGDPALISLLLPKLHAVLHHKAAPPPLAFGPPRR